MRTKGDLSLWFRSTLVGWVGLASFACFPEAHQVTDDVNKPDASSAIDGAAVLPGQEGQTVTSLGDEGGGGWPIQIPAAEVARRLSQFLYKAPPSNWLTQQVIARNPRTNQEVGALTDALLLDERSSQGVRGFYTWWLGLGRWSDRVRPVRSPDSLTAADAESLLNDALTFAESTTWQMPGTYAALMTDPATYVSAATPADRFPRGSVPLERSREPMKIQLPPELYAGILTQPAVVAARDHHNQASPGRRGVDVLERVLCEEMPPPPPDGPTEFPPASGTFRQRYEQTIAYFDSCSSCHQRMDPLGFLFESFDGLGAFRSYDSMAKDMAVDSSAVVGAPLFEEPRRLRGAPDLGTALAASPLAWKCFAANWLAYATGIYKSGAEAMSREDESSDIPYIVKRATVQGQLKLRGVIRAVTETEAFLRP